MAERPSNLYGYVWRTPDTGSHRFSTLGRVSIPVSLSTRCRTIGGTCRSPDYSNKMTETDVEAADGSVSLICVLWDDWHVIVWHGPARIRRAPRRTTAGSWRARRARAPATPATRCPCATHDRYSPPPSSSARPWRRRRNLHLIISIFHTFRLRCSTIYDLHTTSLLWCFVDGLRFCHTFVVAISIKRFDLPRDVGVTKTRSNQLMLCSVYCIIFAQWVCYHISLFVGYRSHSSLVYNEIYLHCRYVNKSNINVHITSHEWGHEVLTLAIPSVN